MPSCLPQKSEFSDQKAFIESGSSAWDGVPLATSDGRIKDSRATGNECD